MSRAILDKVLIGKTAIDYTFWDIVTRLPDRTVIRRRTRVWKVGTICGWLAKDRPRKKWVI
jgi:hypothetical protein